MSKTVDERVVSMQFDNKHFENNVHTSLNTIDKLKKSLNLNGAAKGLENVDAASKRVNMNPLSNAVESIGVKFSAMQVMAVTALSNITNSAVNAGKRIVSAFTIDPIKTGLAEYETQINAVQTILANTQSKGTNLNDVNNALDELNAYADKTIYNFTEMTRNIGTFTAAGVDLDTSVSAIKGIANLAAVSGSTSQQASTAMYQLSQALSSGTVKLMDWNSVVNAGMGGQVFQDALKETARIHGIAIDDMIESEGSFRETLSEGWLSSEILLETLKKFTGDLNEEQLKSMGYTDEQIQEILKLGKTANDAATKVKTFTQLMDTLKEAAQSGWTQTWEILIGDFEEAKKLWTSVSDYFSEVINKSAEARNNLLEGWAKGGGREMAIEALKNAFEGLLSIIKPIKEAFREVFPRMTSEQLLKITKYIKDLTDKFKLSEKQSAKLKSTFKGLFSIIDIGVTFIKEIIVGISKLFSNIIGLGGGILGVTGSLGDWISGLRDSIKESGIFGTVIGGIVNILQKVIDKIKVVINFLKEKIAAPGFESFLSLMNGIWKVVKFIADKIGSVISSIGKGLTDAFRSGDISTGLDILNGGLIAGILITIKKFISGSSGPFSEFKDIFSGLKDILGGVKDVFGSVGESLQAWQQNLKAGILLKLAGAIAILAASILIIASIDPSKLTSSLGAITVLFADLVGAMAIFSKISGPTGAAKSTATMIGMAISVLILASALKKLSGIKIDELVTGVAGVAALTMVVVMAAKALSSNTKTVVKGAVSLVMFALAIKVLSSACITLSSLSWGELFKGLVGVGVLMAAVSVFLNNTKFSGKAIGTATGIVIISASIKILASACKDFGSMDLNSIAKGLGSIAILLAELAIFTRVTGNANHIISTGLALVLIGASMKIFASSIEDLSSLSLEGLVKGLIGMAGALAIVAVVVNLMPKNMVGIGLGLIAISSALAILSSVLLKLGGMSWTDIAQGLVALGGSLAILAIGLNLMNGTLAGSAALIIASVAIGLITPSLLLLSTMSWEGIAKGLVSLAGAFTIMGVAGLILGPIVPVILALAAALALIGVGALAFGAGVLTISVGLTALAAALSSSAAIIVVGLKIIINGIIDLIPSIIAAIGKGIILICQTIAGSVSSICGAITAVLLAIIGALKNAISPLIECLGVLLDSLLKFIVSYTPKIVDAGMKVIVGFLDGIAKNIGKVVEKAVLVVTKFIEGIASQIPVVVEAGFNLIIDFINGLANAIEEKTPLLMEAAVNLATSIIKGLVKGLFSGINAVKEAIVDVAKSAWKAFKDFLGINSPSKKFMSIGKDTIQGFINGVKNKISSAVDTVKQIPSKCVSAIKNKVSDFISAGKNVMSGLIDGIKSKITDVKNAAVNGVKTAVNKVKDFLGINSPSKVFAEFGMGMDEGLIVGLNSYSNEVADSAIGVGKKSIKAMAKTISGISDMVNSDLDNQPTIRPVLDLSNIKSGAGTINDLLNNQSSIGVLSNVGSINSMMNNHKSDSDVISAIETLGRKIGNSVGNTYNINGITYDDGSNISNAVESIVRAARIERRI